MRTFLGVMLISLLASNSARASFVFQDVADTGPDSPFQAVTTPSVGADGTVVFQATLKSGVSGIYTYKNGQLTTIADTTQGYTSFNEVPDVNSHGDVAFATSSGVYKYSNGSITKLPIPLATAPAPSINDDGQVAVTYAGSVEVTDGTTLKSYSGSYFVSEAPVINNSGIVAFASTAPSGCYLGDGTQITQALATSGSNVAMNNLNVVALATSAEGVSRILTGDGTTMTTAATVSLGSPHDGFTAFYTFSAPPINDDGLVCFHPYSGAIPNPQTEALVFGPGWTHVIGTGDSLFGSTIATGQGSELFQGFGLQNSHSSFVGDYMAFRYDLANGIEGIALTQVPEPGFITVFLLVVPLVKRRSRLRRL